jgi:hypothetical protein
MRLWRGAVARRRTARWPGYRPAPAAFATQHSIIDAIRGLLSLDEATCLDVSPRQFDAQRSPHARSSGGVVQYEPALSLDRWLYRLTTLICCRHRAARA